MFASGLRTGSLAYAELGTMMSKSGGEYYYFMQAFGKHHPFWGPLPGFLFAWVSVLLLKTAGTSAIALTFATYIVQPIATAVGLCPDESTKYTLERLIAAACICKCYPILQSSISSICFCFTIPQNGPTEVVSSSKINVFF